MNKKNLLLALAATSLLVGCSKVDEPSESSSQVPSESSSVTSSESGSSSSSQIEGNKTYTYNTYTTVSPSNWNELTYEDNNDTQIMSYISGGFFTFDFKYDDMGEIVDGDFQIKYSGATKLEDVTKTYAGNSKYAVPAEAEKNYAYKITLRNDIKFDDGTPVHARDFVYTMQQQLDPLFKNYRADSFYVGSTVIHNAENYVFQGDEVSNFDNGAGSTGAFKIVDSMDDLEKGQDGVYTYNGNPVSILVGAPSNQCGGDSLADYAAYLEPTSFASLTAEMNEEGLVPATDETLALLATAISTDDWAEDETNIYAYICFDYTYPVVNWDDVGMFVGDNENEIVLVLDSPLDLLKDDGSLSYKAAYNMASLPLVQESKYEANKVEPQAGNDLWTSKYNTSVATTASWGPYKLTSFEAGKQYVLERNDNWYGYNMPENEGRYQTDKIVCDTIGEWNTAWLKFQQGGVDDIGIDVSIAADYKNSSRAIFTPSDFVSSLQIQSDAEALAARESQGINKTIMTYDDFRNAMSLAINRADYNQQCTTASLPGFGLFNSMHYYDVANGGCYRNTDVAREVLCDVYGVDPKNYATLEDAVDAITGYDLAQAKTLVTKAYEDALAAGDISATDKVEIDIGTSTDNESTRRTYEFLKNAFVNMAVGTPLEGRIVCVFSEHDTKWATDFRAGAYDVCTGGWSGAAWDPGYFLLAYLSPAYMYSTAWDTSSQQLTYNPDPSTYDEPLTMSLMEWYTKLNSVWAEGFVDNNFRLGIIAQLEKAVLKKYYSVPISNSYSASLISHKIEYVTRDYNTFMGYGGIEYMTYNYDDAAWAAYIANNTLDYKA